MIYYISQVNTHQLRWSILLQFCCKFTSVSVCPKIIKIQYVFDNVIAKRKRL